MIPITDYPHLGETLKSSPLVFAYVSQPQCNVCKSLLPKVEELLTDYPKIQPVYLDTQLVPEAAGQLSVFSIPTVILFVDGKEYFRLVRTFGLGEIRDKIDRIYAHFE